MLAGKTIFALVAAFALSNAAVMNLYSDQNCQNAAGSRNVYDNTCAPLGGFQSYIITSGGTGGQQLSAFSRNACAGPVTSCTSASNVGICYTAVNNDGGSNAMSSSPVCGSA